MKFELWAKMIVLMFLVLTPFTVHAQDAAGGWNGSHTVQSGENLFRIALQYGVSVNALASANGIYNPNLVYAGQVLRVPGTGSTPTEPGPRPGDPFDVRVTTNTNVYEGQSFESPVRYVLPPGTASASGRSPDSAWVYVRSGYGVQGWVWSASVIADARLLNGLPVMSPHGERPPVSNVYSVNIPNSTNVHLLPNASSPLRTVITPGTVIINGRSQDGAWLSINAYNGIEGWVLTSAVQIDPSMLHALPVTFRQPTSAGQPPALGLQATILQNGIPLRTAPGGETPVIRGLNQQTVTVLGRSWDNTWLRVRTPDRAEGWVWLGDTNLSAGQILNLPALNG